MAWSASPSTSGRPTSATGSAGHFEQDHPQLDISIFRDFDNSRGGYGFLVGAGLRDPARRHGRGFDLNLDIVAHETGHLII